MKFQAKIFTGSSITAVIDGKSYSVGSDHINWNGLLDAYRNNEADAFIKLVDVVATIQNSIGSNPKVKIENDTVYYDGQPIHSVLTIRMLKLLREGHDITSLINFLEDLMKNPSKNAVDELYTFLENKGLGLCEDGSFIAYKSVRENYLDKFSGTISNKPGTVVRMQRNTVVDDKSQHCAQGLHVGCLTYSGPGGWYNSPGDQVILCKVWPRHVVSVPTDHSFTKMRVEEYTVLDNFKGELNKTVYSGKSVADEGYDASEYEHDGDYQDANDDYANMYMDSQDLQEDDSIKFNYKDETRHLLIETIDWDDETVTGKLQHPELACGEYRCFKLGGMSEIELIN